MQFLAAPGRRGRKAYALLQALRVGGVALRFGGLAAETIQIPAQGT